MTQRAQSSGPDFLLVFTSASHWPQQEISKELLLFVDFFISWTLAWQGWGIFLLVPPQGLALREGEEPRQQQSRNSIVRVEP